MTAIAPPAMAVSFLRFEVLRNLRNRRTLLIGNVLPVLLYLLLAGTVGARATRVDGIALPACYMIGMLSFGSLGAVFTSGGRIALERGTGWNRQLRLTALGARPYLLGKILAGYITGLPVSVIIFVLASGHGVHLSAARYLAIEASVLLALIPLALLGVLLGYLARADSLQAITGLAYSGMSILGGFYFPIDDGPRWLVDLAKSLPMYWVADAGRAALKGSWVGWQGLATLAAWAVVIGGLAVRAFLRDTER